MDYNSEKGVFTYDFEEIVLTLAVDNMLDNKYKIRNKPDFKSFEFVSEGPKGAIKKIIYYYETSVKDVYNLGFGDKSDETGKIDDLSITDNGDSRKVLATVAATLYVFTNCYSDATVLATGSTQFRTRLYRMLISNNLEYIEQDFVIFGFTGIHWEPYRKNVNYEAFLVRKKNVNSHI